MKIPTTQCQLLRSLIQKAIRRNNTEMVEKVFDFLWQDSAQRQWLKSRIYVLTLEDCWRFFPYVKPPESKEDLKKQYVALSKVKKYKEVCGLGAVAYRLQDHTNYDHFFQTLDTKYQVTSHEEYLRIYNEVKSHFLDGYEGLGLGFREQPLIENFILTSQKKVFLEWDKVFVAAFAYYLYHYKPKPTKFNDLVTQDTLDFYLGLALDKHSKFGRGKISDFIFGQGISFKQFGMMLFYEEGAQIVGDQDPFWQFEKLFMYKTEKVNQGTLNRFNKILPEWKELSSFVVKGELDELNFFEKNT